MRRSFWMLATVLGLLCFGERSHAQYGLPPYWMGYAQQQSMYFQYRSGPFGGFFAYQQSGAYYRVGPVLPPLYVAPIVVPPVVVPPVIGPFGPVNPPPAIVIQNIIPPGGVEVPRDRGLILPPEVNPARNPVAAAPRAKPAELPKLGPAPQIKIEIPDVPPKGPPPLPGRADADQFTDQGRQAFADGQYGRALERFRKAQLITPNEPSLYFLMSQAQVALGKYQDALASITAGMALRKDWANARFHSRDLHGKAEKRFDEQTALLQETLKTYPDDAGLLFLLAHQLWFDQQREVAKPLLQKASKAGSTLADNFGL